MVGAEERSVQDLVLKVRLFISTMTVARNYTRDPVLFGAGSSIYGLEHSLTSASRTRVGASLLVNPPLPTVTAPGPYRISRERSPVDHTGTRKARSRKPLLILDIF